MGSSRLPGKVMREILDKPIIEYLIERCKKIKMIDQIIVATSDQDNDRKIVEYCKNTQIKVFTGSEKNVLERIYKAAKTYKIKNIIRFTADCPLIDPQVINDQIDYFINNNLEYCFLGLSHAEGICSDIFSFNLLEDAYLNHDKDDEKEHITPYFHKRKKIYRVRSYENGSDDSKFRIVLDCKEDLKVIEILINNLYEKNANFTIQDIKKFLTNNPNVYKINSNIKRNESYDVFKL